MKLSLTTILTIVRWVVARLDNHVTHAVNKAGKMHQKSFELAEKARKHEDEAAVAANISQRLNALIK